MRYTKILLIVLSILMYCFIPACSSISPLVDTPVPTMVTAVQTPKLNPNVKTSQSSEPADIIFHNGNVITIEKVKPLAEAVAVRGNLIQAVGTSEDILAYQGENTIVIDLLGKTLMPGFFDNHTHYLRNGWGDGIPLKEMINNFLRFGYTSETEMHSTDEYINAMLEAEQNGEMDLRLNISAEYNCGFLDENRKSRECISWYKDNPPILDPARMVRIPNVKIFADGAGTAARGCPYYGFDFPASVTDVWPDVWNVCTYPHGDLYLDEVQLTSVIQDLQDRGYRAVFHTMGDGTVQTILNALEAVLDGESNLIYRHQITHNSMLSQKLIDRYVQMDILAEFGGMFNVSEASWYEAAFGKEHAEWAANRYALPGVGIHVSFGNDFNGRGDIKNLNPFRALYGYVTHKEVLSDGTVAEPPDWVAKHKISVGRALEIMTIEGAYAVFMEDFIGSILPGKFADLIIISDDPLTIDPDQLIIISVLMTMVNGEVKYCADGQEAYCPS